MGESARKIGSAGQQAAHYGAPEAADGLPRYQQIFRALQKQILNGELRAGARLPSTRALAEQLGVARNTVVVAYDRLLAEGYLETRTGSGTYVAEQFLSLTEHGFSRSGEKDGGENFQPRLSAYIRRALSISLHPPPIPGKSHPQRKIDFRYGHPDIDHFPREIWRRLTSRHLRYDARASFVYGEPEGLPELREAISAYIYRNRAVSCDPSQVIIVNGSQQGIDLTLRTLIDPGDRVAIEEPHYPGTRLPIEALGARVFGVPVDDDGLQVESLPSFADAPRLVCVTPSHQYPTGVVMSLARRLGLISWADKNDAFILEDDYDGEFNYQARPMEALQALDHRDRVIYLGTFSKVLAPALRIGYVVVPRSLALPTATAKWLADRHSPTLEQAVLADFIREGHFERHLRRSRVRNARKRNILIQALKKAFGTTAEIQGISAGVHLLLKLKDLTWGNVQELLSLAAAETISLYTTEGCYLRRPDQPHLVMGYAGLSEEAIRTGVRSLRRIYGRIA